MDLTMTKTSLSSLRAHPERERLFDYVLDAPERAWIGRLDFLAWGKSQNILCYFTDEATGGKYRLSTFWNRDFAPQREGPCFREEALGSRYEISTSRSKKGLPIFEGACKLDGDLREASALELSN
jgi:hypothetical protein